METKTAGSSGFWILCGGYADRPLALDLPHLGEALAVFSFEEEARLFLDLRCPDDGLRPVRVTAGWLLARLGGSWSGFGSVALDPIPELDGGTLLPLTITDRDRFAAFLAARARREARPPLAAAL